MTTFLNWLLNPFHDSCVAFGLLVVSGIGAMIQLDKLSKNARVIMKRLADKKANEST
jgi:hypothetical protein